MHKFVIFEQKFVQHWSDRSHYRKKIWRFVLCIFIFSNNQWLKKYSEYCTKFPLARQILSLEPVSLIVSVVGWSVWSGNDVDGISVGYVWYVFVVDVDTSLPPNLSTSSSILFIVAGWVSYWWPWRSTHLYENDRQLLEQQSVCAVHCKYIYIYFFYTNAV